MQEFYLDQLQQESKKDNIPVVIAGDLFDKPDNPAELVNFAMRYLPSYVISVAGNHDLPNHNLEEMHRSSYGTLVAANRITDLGIGERADAVGVRFWGFPWRYEDVQPGTDITGSYYEDKLNVAVIHKYCYDEKTGHPGADPSGHFAEISKRFIGFQHILIGDNHAAHRHTLPGCTLFNHGTMIRRRRNERDYKPAMGILYQNGALERKFYDTSMDCFVVDAPAGRASAFVSRLAEEDDTELDFRAALERRAESAPKGVRDRINKIVEGK